jgi:Kelch motif
MGRRARLLVGVVAAIAGGLLVGAALLVFTNPRPREAPGWTLAAPMPLARGEIATAVLEDRLYVLGGLSGAGGTSDAVSVYDAPNDRWTEGPSLPAPRHHAAAAALDGAVYLAGGGQSASDWTPRTNLWRLAADASGWTEVAAMPEGRLGHRLVALDGRLYVVGGIGPTASLLVYDPASDAWSTGAALPSPRDHLAAVAVGTEIWAIGGRDNGLQGRVDIYDPAADAWRAGPPLPVATSGAAEAAADPLILISGGEDPGGSMVDAHWWLDASAAAPGWQPLPDPPLVVHGAQGAALDGRFYVVGGQSFLAWSDATQVFALDSLR